MSRHSQSRFEQLERRALMNAASYGQLPLAFEQNVGQTDARVDYLARGSGYSLFLTDGGNARLALAQSNDQSYALDLRLVGSNSAASATALQPSATRSNYLAADARSSRTDVKNFGQVRYDDVYRGVDVVYYGNQHQLEYDFIVAPGADPKQIATAFDGADSLRLDRAGNLIVHAGSQNLTFQRPVSYQVVDGKRVNVASKFVLSADAKSVSFSLGNYDATRELVIDPLLGYSTYLGGTGYEAGNGIAVDSAGNAYITGVTQATNFPTTTGALRRTKPTEGSVLDGFVTKLNANGTAAVFSTYIPGAQANDIALDSAGNIYLGGAASVDFSATAGAYNSPQMGGDTMVMKLNPAGNAIVYAARVGGDGDEFINSIAVDAQGNVSATGTLFHYGAGATRKFPTVNAFQPEFGGGTNDAFVYKLNSTGSALVYSTYLGGGNIINTTDDWGSDIALDPSGNAYVVGHTFSQDFPTTPGALKTNGGGGLDAFVSSFSPTGAIRYSTFVGGVQHDEAYGIATDGGGNAYITGWTDGSWPTTPGAYQGNETFRDFAAFVSKINPTGSAFVYSTYINGSQDVDRGWDIAVDRSGQAIVVGDTKSSNFPAVNAIQPTYKGGLGDGFVTKLNQGGSNVIYSTYLGGTLSDQATAVATDASGAAYVTGNTSSFNFPTSSGAFQAGNGGGLNSHDDAFVTKIIDTTTPPPPPPSGAISGTLFIDSNSNGAMDSSESGAANWTVYLDANNNGKLDTGEVNTQTQPFTRNNFTFSGLAAGTYTVREVPQKRYRQTLPTALAYTVTLTDGQSVTGRNFGNVSMKAGETGVATQPDDNNTVGGTLTADGVFNGSQRISVPGLSNDDPHAEFVTLEQLR